MLFSLLRRYFILLGLLAAVQGNCQAAQERTLLVVGDSISAEYGLPRGRLSMPASAVTPALADARACQRCCNSTGPTVC